MPTLAPKLPYTHPFAGGYPRLGGQPLPTDPDAIDYLERVAAADGAAVEVGVAMAVDAFVRGCKADGIWSALKASCILCGARTISGALVPLVGTAPTAYSFASGDYDRSSGLKGDGSTKYLDTNRANDADGQDDRHWSVYLTQANASVNQTPFGSLQSTPSYSVNDLFLSSGDGRAYSVSGVGVTDYALFSGFNSLVPTLVAATRSSDTSFSARAGGSVVNVAATSVRTYPYKEAVFARNNGGVIDSKSDARLAFYSIGSALDLAALDNRVSTLVSAIAAAI